MIRVNAIRVARRFDGAENRIAVTRNVRLRMVRGLHTTRVPHLTATLTPIRDGNLRKLSAFSNGSR